MSESHTAAHAESATDLYNLWQGWLDATNIHASAFEGVEDRLRSSLDHCACALRMDEPVDGSTTQPKKEPTKEADCFVFLASHIGSPRPATSDAGYGLAYRWLAQDAGKAAAAEAALSLYPPTDNTTLLTLYSEQESLRPALFRIFRKQMQAIPVAMVNTAATADTSSDALKIEALRYAAANADIGMDVFRTHYLPLLSGKTNFNTRIMEVAIWGGMLRSDPDASRAISVALSHTHSPQYRTQLLRLAALTGAAEYLPLLLNAAESDPDTGYPLLVLFGQKSVMPELLKALEIAHTMEQAAAAFSQLSDQMLPRVPRLTVVDEEEDDAEDDAQRIPDVRAARDWWDKHQAKWQAGERWLFGKPANAVHLTAMSKKHAGSFGRDLMALLALAQKAPLNIPTEIWRARQQQLLADKMAAQPAAQATNQPAKARKA